jgi:hypothetical protein
MMPISVSFGSTWLTRPADLDWLIAYDLRGDTLTVQCDAAKLTAAHRTVSITTARWRVGEREFESGAVGRTAGRMIVTAREVAR